MDGTWWAVVWGIIIVGGWAGNQGRAALKTRHQRRMERAELEDRRRAALEAAKRPPEPVCGCTHHLAKHDKQGRCHESVQTPVTWDKDKTPVSYEARQCNCQQYIGPEPLATFYAPELTE